MANMHQVLCITRMLCIVEERYTDPSLSLKALSVNMNMSERHLGRLFRKSAGQSFRQYLRSLRISEGARLLTASMDDVKMIALVVGYNDPSHFGQDFRLSMGRTPAKFRAENT